MNWSLDVDLIDKIHNFVIYLFPRSSICYEESPLSDRYLNYTRLDIVVWKNRFHIDRRICSNKDIRYFCDTEKSSIVRSLKNIRLIKNFSRFFLFCLLKAVHVGKKRTCFLITQWVLVRRAYTRNHRFYAPTLCSLSKQLRTNKLLNTKLSENKHRRYLTIHDQLSYNIQYTYG